MRWVFGAMAVVLAAACSDDGVPQASTGEGTAETGGSTGSGADESAVTTEQSTATTNSGTSDSNAATSIAETSGTGDTTGDGSSSEPGGTSSGDSGTGTSGSESSGSSGGTTGGPLNVGEDCTDDAECMTLVCWDFSDYDAMCFGAACSGECMNDDDCVALLTDAGAAYPEQSTCGADGRCTMVGTGFGSFACAAP
jgi:hypothetical protein